MSDPHNDDADRVLRSLARLAREQEQADDERVDALSETLGHDNLSPAGRRQIEEKVQADPDLHRFHEGMRTLDEDFRAEIVVNARRQLQADARAYRRPWIWGLALAASMLLALGLLRQLDRTSPLPRYTHTWQGGLETARGGAATHASRPRLHDGAALTLIAAPEEVVEGPLAVRGFILSEGRVRPWPEAHRYAEIADTGAVRLHVTLGRELVLPPGEATLLLTVGRPHKLPDAAEVEHALDRAQVSPGRPWHLIRQVVDVVER